MLVTAAGPALLVLARAFLLLVAVHQAAQPLAHAARQVLDVVDSALDAVGAGALHAWAWVAGWSTARRDGWVERVESFWDVPEKLAGVHAIGLLTELTLFAALLPLAWHARAVPALPWAAWRHWPSLAWMRLNTLPRWMRVERAVVAPWLLLGCVHVGLRMRRAVVLVVSQHLSGDLLFAVSFLAGAAGGLLCAWHVGAPMMLADGAASDRSGRTRRLLTLLLVPLGVAALVEAAW